MERQGRSRQTAGLCCNRPYRNFYTQLLQAVSDLRDDDSIYSNEKALLLMFNKAEGIQNFNGSGLERSTEQSKQELIR